MSRLFFALFSAYLVFVIYGSLVPLDFRPIPIDQAVDRFKALPFLNLGVDSRADWVANFLLFVPLSFFAMAATKLIPTRQRIVSMLIVASLCVLLSLAIEFTQIFFPQRTVSQNDIIAESLGAIAGLAIHQWFGPSVKAWLSAFQKPANTFDMWGAALKAYLLVLILFSVLPLDLTISPIEIARKWKEGRINLVPFGNMPADFVEAAYKFATDLLIWVPVGIYWRIRGRSFSTILITGFALALVIESMQVFVYSRFTNVTDVLVASIGCLIGGVISTHTSARKNQQENPARRPLSHLPSIPKLQWVAAFLIWAVAITAAFWFPYDFNADARFLATRVGMLARVPFETYYFGSEYRAINEVFRKLLFFAPGGLIWAGAIQSSRVKSRRIPIVTGALLLSGVAILVEGGQLFLPGKTADLTDAVLSIIGALSGLYLGLRLNRVSSARISIEKPARHHSARSLHWINDLRSIFFLAVALFFASRLPGVPYNVAELFSETIGGISAALSISVCVWLMLGAPLAVSKQLRRKPGHAALLPLAMPFLGMAIATLLLAAAPEESVFDIVGSPVLDWPWQLESLLRLTALFSAVLLATTGGIWLSMSMAAVKSRTLAGWLLTAGLWALPLHWSIVEQAATDNLVELMRGGGGLLVSLALFSGLVTVFCGAGAFSFCFFASSRRIFLASIALLAIPVSGGLLWLGLEPFIFKYGQAFSAPQFLLSASRQNYADPAGLWLRFTSLMIALYGTTVMLNFRRLKAIKSAAD